MALQTKTASAATPPAAPKATKSASQPSSADVQASLAFEAYCEELTNRYARLIQWRTLRWVPAVLLIGGLALGYVLMHLQLSWFFLGPSMSIAAIATLLALGGLDGVQPIRTRLVIWCRTWPVWEIIVASLLGCLCFGAAIHFGAWPLILLGSIIGAGGAAVFHLAMIVPMSDRIESTVQEFSGLVSNLSSHGLSEQAIEEGMPRLMGTNWAPLFETHFGYEAYRNIRHHLSYVRPDLSRSGRRIRNLISDWLTLNARYRRGPILALNACRTTIGQSRTDQLYLKQPATLDFDPAMDEPSASSSLMTRPISSASSGLSKPIMHRGELVADSLSAASLHVAEGAGNGSVHGNHAHLHAESIQIGTVHTDNLSVALTSAQLMELASLAQFSGAQPNMPVGMKKLKYDRLLQEAWSSNTKRRKRFPKLQRFFGEEARLTTGFVLLAVFFGYLFQAGLFSETVRQQLTDGWSTVQWTSLEQITAACSTTFATIANLPATIDPIGISGWAIGLISVLIGLSGLREGWAFACFVIPAAILLLAGCSITPNDFSPIVVVSMLVAVVLVVIGYFADGRIIDAIVTRSTRQ